MARINVGGLLLALASGALGGFKTPNSVQNDLGDVELGLQIAEKIDPGLLPGAALHQAESTVAGLSNLKTGQVAVIGSVGASFDGQADKVVTISFRQYINGGAPAGAPATAIKELLSL